MLSTTDPYAVSGMLEVFESSPDLVTGKATRTKAGIALLQKLSGIKALNVTDRDALPELRDIMRDALDL